MEALNAVEQRQMLLMIAGSAAGIQQQGLLL